VRLSARPKHVRTLIVNGETAVRAQLHRVCEDRPDLDVIAEATHGAQAIDVFPPHFNAAVDHAIGARINDLRPPQIIGERSGRIYFLDAHEVEYLASAGNYVVAHVGANEFLARATLKRISASLAPLGFVQIERSLLVNLRQVAHVERHERGQFCFVMRGGARLISSRERGSDIRALLFGASPIRP
jgi:DNA-binding LytR/AlgR family response regulator